MTGNDFDSPFVCFNLLCLLAKTFIRSNRAQKKFTEKSKYQIGRVYKKAVFREYTDNTFTTQKSHSAELGLLGPTLYSVEGETIKVQFFEKSFIDVMFFQVVVKNMVNLRSLTTNETGFTVSFMAHGWVYDKINEGRYYSGDGTLQDGLRLSGLIRAGDNLIPYGQTYDYIFKVPTLLTDTSSRRLLNQNFFNGSEVFCYCQHSCITPTQCCLRVFLLVLLEQLSSQNNMLQIHKEDRLM